MGSTNAVIIYGESNKRNKKSSGNNHQSYNHLWICATSGEARMVPADETKNAIETAQ